MKWMLDDIQQKFMVYFPPPSINQSLQQATVPVGLCTASAFPLRSFCSGPCPSVVTSASGCRSQSSALSSGGDSALRWTASPERTSGIRFYIKRKRGKFINLGIHTLQTRSSMDELDMTNLRWWLLGFTLKLHLFPWGNGSSRWAHLTQVPLLTTDRSVVRSRCCCVQMLESPAAHGQ